MLSEDRVRPILDVVERELLTPFGLRTLSPKDSHYCPRYEGPGYQRDAAYHQGTVWPWLMGPFITAYVKVHGRTDAARLRAKGWIEGFIPHLQTAGLGQVSEILDAGAPHTPRGCIAQAWSVAELLRVALEDVYAT
jgi:glycogen debranching enzyme